MSKEFNTKFIGISADIKEDLLISVILGAVFIALGRWNSIFILGTPQAGYFSAEVAAMSISGQALLVILVAPILETVLVLFFFFGVISTLLDRYVVHNVPIRLAITILLTSFIFSSLHIFAYGSSLSAAYLGAFTFNAVAAVLLVWRQSQIIPTIMHMVVNGAIWWGLFCFF